MNLDFIRIIDKLFGHVIACMLCLCIYGKRMFPCGKESAQIKKILVVRFFGFGNLVLAFPTIKKISELFPDAKICLLTINKNKHLYDAVDFVDKTVYINVYSVKDFVFSLLRVFFYLRREKFDMAVDFEIFAYISTFLIYMCGIKRELGIK